MGTRGRCFGFWLGIASVAAAPLAATAESLQLPPGAIVLPLRSTRSAIQPAAPSSITIARPTVAAANRTPLGVELPPGAVVIYSGPTPPWAAADVHGAATPPADVAEAITTAAARHGLSRSLVEAVAWQESRFDNDRVSPKGARGVMQLMPETARALQVNERDLRSNVEGGTAYLASLLRQFSGDLSLALAAYNAGPETVVRYGGIPPYTETQAYVKAIFTRLNQ